MHASSYSRGCSRNWKCRQLGLCRLCLLLAERSAWQRAQVLHAACEGPQKGSFIAACRPATAHDLTTVIDRVRKTGTAVQAQQP
jgi:hypothetical protein